MKTADVDYLKETKIVLAHDDDLVSWKPVE